ncbi:DUF2243 domain-containing protein [Alkalibacillus aidingensis]|uniref:DUF2243 domain-containing protein n=1 Tax=Alkalibacillus aidingensis TaxID=2747607 RepID=UPI00166133F4|nr:DUF2243 domain-containing protein [Alkalibacillus aidingensis]
MIRRNIWAGVLFGIGGIAFIDEFVFHQLLQWHHFYDKSTTEVGILSDGLFHAFSWFATIGGLFLLADLNRRQSYQARRWWGGVLIGVGAFQLYDGVIQHKLMRIHQIRYVDHVIIYDLVWNMVAVVILVIGVLMVRRSKSNKKTKES